MHSRSPENSCRPETVNPACYSSFSESFEEFEQLSGNAFEVKCRCDELIFLNRFLKQSPINIRLFDSNPASIEYLKLILELIEHSKTPEDFISKIFCRRVEEFLEKKELLLPFSQLKLKEGKDRIDAGHTLNCFTQWSYLQMPVDKRLQKETEDRLSNQGKNRFLQYLSPYQPGCVLFDRTVCRRLLPCWPVTERVPYSKEGKLGKNGFGELEPNTNTFHYGQGWLADGASYGRVRKILLEAEIALIVDAL